MKKQNVLNISGEKVKDITLSKEVFGIEPNDTVLYDAIKLAQNSARQDRPLSRLQTYAA